MTFIAVRVDPTAVAAICGCVCGLVTAACGARKAVAASFGNTGADAHTRDHAVVAACGGVCWWFARSYVFVAVFFTQLIVRPVSKSTFALNAAEGTFRFVHARVKEFAEVICMYAGQADEHARARAVFRQLYGSFFRLFRWQWLLSWVGYVFSSAGGGVCFLILAYIIHAEGGTLEGQPVNTATVNATVSALQVRRGCGAGVGVP